MTTPLTIHGLGLCGNSANESIGKHCFWTKKQQKVNKGSQKTSLGRFGYWRPRVRVPPLRPKKERAALAVTLSFLVSEAGGIKKMPSIFFCIRRKAPLPSHIRPSNPCGCSLFFWSPKPVG